MKKYSLEFDNIHELSEAYNVFQKESIDNSLYLRVLLKRKGIPFIVLDDFGVAFDLADADKAGVTDMSDLIESVMLDHTLKYSKVGIRINK